MFTASGILAGYGGVDVLHGIDLAVGPGSIVAVLGPNGAGKTTLARCLAGLHRIDSGEISVDGRSVTRVPTPKRMRLGVSLVPETRGLFPGLTVADNLQLGGWSAAREDRAARFDEVLSLFPRLRERASQLAGSLSGGEQQMLAVGRALMAGPRYLILDEPSLGLAPLVISLIFDQLVSLRAAGLGIVLIEQNAVKALAIADEAVLVERGRVAMSGPAAAVAADTRVAASYLGSSAHIERSRS